ncbi:MAG: hypothetical protein A3A80_00685 [Candidatus Terrybacteria bacterium RIFCSPLOWO2_01_FULL_44_24]|uniref:DUF3592 domain-containing protein n=1 Tax=Candidatus Terrybacteria bacterium RIFCSPHIGHO2_01_FULL_43_35 TaxID=1802361 RepID=A0A1G2PCN7_9BACT|nr:MAG: hypothetical protein A2828_02690 [Candidatus Terrybacteria bacterium RIFCSPHIGHO2_01_FULL_43_35]OHA49507.1 MAG: hypothetical protein A3B75_00015 [Candidatus Terrybacteria bacterium RIFCSPHIGHO2_02_FULL_43_14]OHA51441.1 MAG: hypothetical protein A3A80_00685 [Candidatus Terrybacteria bacterium RIFCSPLOWO2_01_FULL_44_24]
MPIFIVIGAALTIFWGIPTARNAMESKNWPLSEGRITVSDVSENYDSDNNGKTYSAKVAFEYTVNGRQYVGSRVTFGDYDSSDPAHASGIVMRYPVGESVQVYYDPDEPKTSVLEPGTSWSSFVGLGAGGIFSLIGIIGFAFALKKVRSGGATVAPQVAPPTPPQP